MVAVSFSAYALIDRVLTRCPSGTGLMIRFDENTSLGAIIGTTIVAGLGVGNVFQPVLVAIQAHAPKSYRAVVISNRNFLRSLGGAIGLAVCAQLLQSTLKKNLPANLAYIAASTYHLPNLSTLSAADREIVVHAFSQASHVVFIFFAPFVGACLLTQILVPGKSLEEQKDDTKAPITTEQQIAPETQQIADEEKAQSTVPRNQAKRADG